jgi:hypothetical protein
MGLKEATSNIFLKSLGLVADPVFRYYSKKNNLRINIATEVAIDDEWKEFSLPIPRRPMKTWPKIEFSLDDCYMPDEPGEIIFGGGETLDPKKDMFVEIGENNYRKRLRRSSYLVRADGHDPATGFRRLSSIVFPFRYDEHIYTKLWIRSAVPFRCRSLNWYHHRPK